MLKKIMATVLLSFLISAGICNAAPLKDAPDLVSYPLVLEYHQIRPVAHSDLDVSVENFKQELDWLQEHNYRTLSLYKFNRCIDKHQPLPPKSVLITFDDGYEGVYKYALPELRKRYMHATLFLVTDSLNKKDPAYARITTAQVQKMGHDYLVDLGSHTVNHEELSPLSAAQLDYELSYSKAALEKLTDKPCLALSYPYGDFNTQVLSAVKNAGYRVAFAGYDDNIASHLKRYTIPRIYVGQYLEKNNFKAFKQTFNE